MEPDVCGQTLFAMVWTPEATNLRRVAETIPETWVAACTAVAHDLPFQQNGEDSLDRVEWEVLLGDNGLPADCISLGISTRAGVRHEGLVVCDYSHLDDTLTDAVRFVVYQTQDALNRMNILWPFGDAGRQMSVASRDGEPVWLEHRLSAVVSAVGALGL